MKAESRITDRESRTGVAVRLGLVPADAVMIAYHLIVASVVLASWMKLQRPLAYLAFNAAMIACVVGVARLDRGPGVWRFIHYWLPTLVLPLSFTELKHLVPVVNPFDDRRYDWMLHDWDVALFGDVAGFCRSIASPLAADVLFACYVLFYPLPFIAFGIVYARGQYAAFREIASVVFLGWLLSYVGYIAVPALGPHHVTDGPRAPALDGLVWGRFAYETLARLEGRMPDAFPSGHSLVTVLFLWALWRHARRAFWILLPGCAGLVVATVYLRYHYVTDVVVGLALVPVAIWGGLALHRRWEPPTGTAPAA